MSVDEARRQTSGSTPRPTRESSISVAVRVRPFTLLEQNNLIQKENDVFFVGGGSLTKSGNTNTRHNPRGIRKIIDVVDDKMLIFDPPETNPLHHMQRNAFPRATSRIREHRFVFDQLFDEGVTQQDVFSATTYPLLDSVLDGFNATVFAYGATGCGKTHTILGTQENPGIIFLTMQELFARMDAMAETKTFDVSLSYLEIYNETIRDLLNPEIDNKKLILREDFNQRISVSNLLIHKPTSVHEVMELLIIGNSNRMTSPTDANSTSSRSHAVLQINVVQKDKFSDVSQQHIFATLSIIDLAGSERAAATKNRGARLTEGANINKSLLALGNCINALCDPRRRNHIPYRDSKLTRLLKFSLDGNCKTVMIVCVSPSSQHYDETLNTLKYADRAKEIKTKLVRNKHNLDRHVGSYLKMITEQKEEIEKLRARESGIIDQVVLKERELNTKCLHSIIESINKVKSSLDKQTTEKWNKYFILAKRKLLLLQRIDTDTVLQETTKVNTPNGAIIIDLCEQLISKIDLQIDELESQYASPNEIDHILEGSSQHMLKRMKEMEGWSESMTKLFDKFIEKERECFEKDVLFYSSILFDYLVHLLSDFNFFPRQLVNCLKDNTIDALIKFLEKLNGGDFDVAVEEHTSAFMQEKLQADLEGTDGNYHKRPHSPTKLSPRSSKRISSRTSTPHASPVSILKPKKVRWNVPKNDTSMLDSDISFNDTIIHHENHIDGISLEESPSANNTLLELSNDLGFQFDPKIDSPLANKNSENDPSMFPEIKSTNGKFTNRRLSITLKSPEDSSDSKMPLLNKQASIKLSNSLIPTITPRPGSTGKFPEMLQLNREINGFSHHDDENDRDIESKGSEKVE
jgi:kinesin family protein 18/19